MGKRTQDRPTIKSREEVAIYSKGYSLSYEKSRAAAAKEGRGFMRKKDFLLLKRESKTGTPLTQASGVSWIRRGVTIEDDEVKGATAVSPVPEKAPYGRMLRYSMVLTIIKTRTGKDASRKYPAGEYRVSILTKEKLDRDVAGRLDHYMSRLRNHYPVPFNRWTTAYELGERVSTFQPAGIYGEYVAYDLSSTYNPMIGRYAIGGASIRYRKKWRYNSMMGYWEKR